MGGSAAAAARRIARLFGSELGGSEAGVCQVAAVWGPERRFIEVRPGSPRSETDRFVLSLSRARSDAIVTTGAILRAEPAVTHAIESADLRAWRREHLQKTKDPISLVLTSGRGLGPFHPMFRSPRTLAYTSADSFPGIDVDVVRDPEASLARAIRYLRDELRCRQIALEIGPRTTEEAFFRDPPLPTELLLSLFLEPELAPAYRGGLFPAEQRLCERFRDAVPPVSSREKSGWWQFHWYRRR